MCSMIQFRQLVLVAVELLQGRVGAEVQSAERILGTVQRGHGSEVLDASQGRNVPFPDSNAGPAADRGPLGVGDDTVVAFVILAG